MTSHANDLQQQQPPMTHLGTAILTSMEKFFVEELRISKQLLGDASYGLLWHFDEVGRRMLQKLTFARGSTMVEIWQKYSNFTPWLSLQLTNGAKEGRCTVKWQIYSHHRSLQLVRYVTAMHTTLLQYGIFSWASNPMHFKKIIRNKNAFSEYLKHMFLLPREGYDTWIQHSYLCGIHLWSLKMASAPNIFLKTWRRHY